MAVYTLTIITVLTNRLSDCHAEMLRVDMVERAGEEAEWQQQEKGWDRVAAGEGVERLQQGKGWSSGGRGRGGAAAAEEGVEW